MDVAVIDSGGANLASLGFALERLGVRARVTDDPSAIAAAARVILPGVGSAADAMQRLRANGIADLVPRLKQPVLGICLGMQLLFEYSEEGPSECLGVIAGQVRRLHPMPGRPVPHMGWNQLKCQQPNPLLEDIAELEYMYFVHSYAAPVSALTVATAEYGDEFPAVVARGNFHGTQFHPERSGAAGARLLANFLRLR
jgi:imidazole glycerol-phosphate synthase subunit HisH